MQCHNPLDRSANRREGGGGGQKTARANSTTHGAPFSPEWAKQSSRESGNGWRRSDCSKNRSDHDLRSPPPAYSSERGSSERYGSGTRYRSELPPRHKEERSEGILARESDRKPVMRNFRDRPSSVQREVGSRFERDKEPQKEEDEDPLEPWEIERARNRTNRLNWALALAAAASASPSSTSPSLSSSSSSTSSSTFDAFASLSSPSYPGFSSSSLITTTSSSTLTSSNGSSEEDGLSASMIQMKLDGTPVTVHGRLHKLPSASPLPSLSPAPGSGRRYIDPERQAEIDAQFGMSAEADTGHMLELYELDTVDPDLLVPMLGPHVEGLYQLSENQCAAIFDNKAHAQEWLRKNNFVAGKVQALHPLRLQQYSHLLPKKFRPETTTKLARRIIFHNLAIRTERTPEEKARRERKTPQTQIERSAWE